MFARKLSRGLAVAIMLLAMLLPALLKSAMAAEYEKPPSLPVADIYPGIVLKGEYYAIEASVPTDGFLTRAVINSDFGEFIAIGPGMLETRLNEIHALKKLETFEASEEFQRGAKESANEKWESLKQVVDKPKEAAAGLSAGVSRFFKRSYRAAKTGVQTVDDVVHDRKPGSTEGAGANLPGKTQEQAVSAGQSKYEKAAKATGSAAINILGFDNSRRKLAKRLGVDPYTTNRVLDEKLDEITWSIFAGDFGIDVATSLIPGSIVVSTSSLVTNWVWDTPPGDLRVKIEEVLLRLNINQDHVDRLLRHRSYPLSYQAALTFALEALGDVRGHERIMPMALSVNSTDQARFVVNSLRMLKQYHETMQPLEVLHVQGAIFASNDKGHLIIAAPVDYLSWTEVVDKFSGNSELSGKQPELYLAGAVSELANKQLMLRGWTIHQNSVLFTTMAGGEPQLKDQ